MEKVKSPRQQYSEELKLTVLKDMYENNVSHLSVARKYGVSEACTYLWEKKYPVDSKLLSLSDQVITRVKAMQKGKRIRDATLHTFIYHYIFAAKSKSLII